jgi:hypothetical protein
MYTRLEQQPVQPQQQQQQSQPAAATAAAAAATPADRGVINGESGLTDVDATEQRLFERAVAEATAEGSVFDGLYGMFEPGGRGMIPPDSDPVIPAATAVVQSQQQQQQQAVATVAAAAEEGYEPVNDYDAAPDFSEEVI